MPALPCFQKNLTKGIFVVCLVAASGCGDDGNKAPAPPPGPDYTGCDVVVEPSASDDEKVQTALIEAAPQSTVCLGAGTFSFTEERSIFDLESLVSLAVEEGLDAAEVREALESDRYVDAVTRDLDEARMLGVTGVPFFVIDNRYGISGAQATDIFSRALTMASQSNETSETTPR